MSDKNGCGLLSMKIKISWCRDYDCSISTMHHGVCLGICIAIGREAHWNGGNEFLDFASVFFGGPAICFTLPIPMKAVSQSQFILGCSQARYIFKVGNYSICSLHFSGASLKAFNSFANWPWACQLLLQRSKVFFHKVRVTYQLFPPWDWALYHTARWSQRRFRKRNMNLYPILHSWGVQGVGYAER